MPIYRYPGAHPFSTDDQYIFFGRENDVNKLYRQINLESLTVLYSKSGLGKSSLLNAGIIPKFKAEGKYVPVNIRFRAYTKGKLSPLESISQLIDNSSDSDSILNQVLENDNSLWYLFKQSQILHKNKKHFLLIFDQFEEIFTYPKEEVLEFKHQLAELIGQNIPQRFREILETKYNEQNNQVSEEYLNILHQKFDIKVVFAIRSDRLSLLNDFSDSFPDVLKKCYQLNPLSSDEAEDAILNPAYELNNKFKCPQFDYDNDFLEKILKYLTKGNTQHIETFQLQILCQRIEEVVIENNLKIITAEHIGNIEDVYENYYEVQLNKIGNKTNRIKARKLIEEELILEEEERRLSLYEGRITKQFNIQKKLLKKLVNTHIIRAETSSKGGFIYEVSHDTLVAPILKSKRKRLEKINVETEKKLRKQKEAELEELNKKREIENKIAADKIAKQRKRIFWMAASVGLSIAALLYAFYANKLAEKALISANESLDLEKKAKSNSILNVAQLNLDIDPTLSFRLAEEAYNTHKNPKAKKAILNAYNKSNTVQFYNSLQAHKKGKDINFISFSPDGQFLLSASDDNKVIIWNTKGEIIQKFEGHKAAVRTACFSKESNKIASASTDGTIIIWEIGATSNPIAYKNNSSINSLCFSPNETSVFAATDDHKLLQWNFLTNQIEFTYDHKGEVYLVGCSNKGNYLFSHSSDNYIRKFKIGENSLVEHQSSYTASVNKESCGLYPNSNAFFAIRDISKKEKSRQIDIYKFDSEAPNNIKSQNRVIAAALSSNSKTLVYSDSNNDIKIIDLKTKKDKASIQKAHYGKIYKLLFSPNNQYFASVSDDQSVKIWNSMGDLLQEIKGHKSFETQIAFSPDGETLATTVNEELRTWQFKKDKITVFRAHSGLAVNDLLILNDNNQFLSAGGDDIIKVWNFGAKVKTRNFAEEIEPAQEYQYPEMKKVHRLSISKTEKKQYQNTFAAISENLVFTWKIDSTTPERIMNRHNKDVTSVDFSDDGSYLISCDKDGVLYEWANTNNDQEIIKRIYLRPDYHLLENKYFGENSVYIITTPNSKELNHAIYIYEKNNLDNLKNLNDISAKKLFGHKDKINIIELSDNKNLFASGSEDKSIIIWNKDGVQLSKLLGHTDGIIDLDFSYDDKFLVSTSKDMTVRVWDLTTFELLLTISEHNQKINTVCFSEKTNYIFSGSEDGTIRIKPIELNIDTIFKKVNFEKEFGEIRNLSLQEMEKYGIDSLRNK